jgi:hypothetical protein
MGFCPILNLQGCKDNVFSLKEYWKIPSTYWEDEEVKNSVFYMKLNIFQYSNLSINDNVIDASLIDYKSNKEVNLLSLQNPARPLVILAGSMT